MQRYHPDRTHLNVCFILLCCSIFPGSHISVASESDQPAAPREFDVIVPKSGHSLFGLFQSTTQDGFLFLLDSGMQMNVPWEKIKQLQINHKVSVTSTGTKSVDSEAALKEFDQVVISTDKAVLLIRGDNTTMTIPHENVVSISNRTKMVSDPTTWSGLIAPSAGLVTGIQGQQTFGGSLYLKRTAHPALEDWHHQSTELQLDASSVLVTQANSPSIRANEYDGKLNHAVTLTKHLYANAFASGYHNSSLAVYLEQSYGAGLGGRIESKKYSLELVGDLLFAGEHFYGTTRGVDFAAADLTESFTIILGHLRGGNLTFGETGAYVPAFDRQNAWQARGNANLSVPLFKRFSWNIQYRDDYVQNAPTLRKNWSTTSAGIAYTLSLP